ncbi:MAG TPA: glycosyltransferase [Candidatus Eisenbacteria bacterium]|nr:glycosyltransferase [Candidatus Eisenbacteria bacterium]
MAEAPDDGPARAGGQRAAADRSRLLVVTSIYPTRDRLEAGAFVWRRVEALRTRGVAVDVLAPSGYRSSALVRHAALLVRALLPRRRPDGVEGHVLLVAGLIALAAARLHRRPLLIYAHGADVRVTAQRSPVHRALARLVARQADIVVTNSAATAELVARLGASAEIVPPGVDFERFSPADRTDARARIGLPSHGLVALYVGGLSPRKGADVFAAAIAAVPSWHGIMVGEGELEPLIRAKNPAIDLIGVKAPDDVPDWMRAADVVVVPSREEPLGLAAVEALACGVPVVASETGGLAEVVQPEVNGLLIPAADSSALSAALRRLEDGGLRLRLGAAARASVARHDIRTTSEEMSRLWRQLGLTT